MSICDSPLQNVETTIAVAKEFLKERGQGKKATEQEETEARHYGGDDERVVSEIGRERLMVQHQRVTES